MPKYLTQPGETTIAGIAGDNEPRYFRVIPENRGILTIDPNMAKTLAGKQFFYSEAFELAETSDVRDYIFETPDTTKWAHIIIDASGSAITEFSFWEDTQYSSTDALTTYNNNRNSTDTPTCNVYLVTATSSTDTGTRLLHRKSGSATQQARSSMEVGYADELILKQNAKYRISFATETTSNLCNMRLHWHEHVSGS